MDMHRLLLLPFLLASIDAFAGPWTVGSRTPIKFTDTPPLPTFPSAPGTPPGSFSPTAPAPIVGNAPQPPPGNKAAEPSTENSTLKNQAEPKDGAKRRDEPALVELPSRHPEKRNEETTEPSSRTPSQPDSVAKPILPRGTKEPSRPIIPEGKTKPNIPDDAFDKKRDKDDDSKTTFGKKKKDRRSKSKGKDDDEPEEEDDEDDLDSKGRKRKAPNYTVPKRRTRMQSNTAASTSGGSAVVAFLAALITMALSL